MEETPYLSRPPQIQIIGSITGDYVEVNRPHRPIPPEGEGAGNHIHGEEDLGSNCMVMILPQVHLRKPCYDFTFL